MHQREPGERLRHGDVAVVRIRAFDERFGACLGRETLEIKLVYRLREALGIVQYDYTALRDPAAKPNVRRDASLGGRARFRL